MSLFSEADLEFSPEEMEFFAEEEVITVIPNVSFKTTDSSLICIGVCPLRSLSAQAGLTAAQAVMHYRVSGDPSDPISQ
ncbi:hypothetical protein ABBQ38_008996 [Trebouxia sp. C0009 RCD-2024]